MILGPCPCSNCGRLLVWDGWEWKNHTGPGGGDHHECLARARATWDNDAVEYSDHIAHNAQRPPARLYSESGDVDVAEYRRND